MSKFHWLFLQFIKKLWVRTSMFAALAVVTALAAFFFKDYVPDDFSRRIGSDSVDSLLRIIANSMLAVTTFSVSIMVAAYSAATNNATPRSTRLLLDDNTSQNALSVFIGSFIFSIVSLIALKMEIYGESGRLFLFSVTVLVIVIIVLVMIQWINYLARLGRVNMTIDMVERETAKSLRNFSGMPYLEGAPLSDYTPGSTHRPVITPAIGHIQHIDIRLLHNRAKDYGCNIYLQFVPGDFYDGLSPLMFASCPLTEEQEKKVVKAFSIGGERSFTQDPRFGLIVLSEIASRALSPALNDPGTAIDIIQTGQSVLTELVKAESQTKPDIRYANVYVPPVDMKSLFNGFFHPIARDGAAIIEVGIHIQKALTALAAAGDDTIKQLARDHSHLAFKRTQKALTLAEDRDRLKQFLL